MSDDNLIDSCLSALAREIGVERLSLDDEGFCALEHSDGFVFTLIAPEGTDLIHLSSRLMDVPQTGREVFFSRLLRLNFLHLQTSGATLAIDEEEDGVFLCHSLVRARLSADGLLNVIGNFLASSSRMRTRLLSSDADDEGGSSPGSLASGWLAV